MLKKYFVDVNEINEMRALGEINLPDEVEDIYDCVEVTIDENDRVSIWGQRNGSSDMFDDNAYVDSDSLSERSYEKTIELTNVEWAKIITQRDSSINYEECLEELDKMRDEEAETEEMDLDEFKELTQDIIYGFKELHEELV